MHRRRLARVLGWTGLTVAALEALVLTLILAFFMGAFGGEQDFEFGVVFGAVLWGVWPLVGLAGVSLLTERARRGAAAGAFLLATVGVLVVSFVKLHAVVFAGAAWLAWTCRD